MGDRGCRRHGDCKQQEGEGQERRVKENKREQEGWKEKERERSHGRRAKTINKIARSEETRARIRRMSLVHFLPGHARRHAFHELSHRVLFLSAKRRIRICSQEIGGTGLKGLRAFP